MRRRGGALAAAIFALAIPQATTAQASAYLPLDDVAYQYIDALIGRGGLRSLPLMVRPYTVASVQRAMTADSLTATSHALLHRSLRAALARYAVPPPAGADSGQTGERFDATLMLGGMLTAQTSDRRELMLAAGATRAYPGAIARMQASTGRVIALTRIVGDLRLLEDPEFAGKKDRWIAGRVEDAYLSIQWRFGELFFGRQGRNWGPPSLDGLLLGNYAYSYDHLFGRIGGERIALSALVSRLNDDVDSTGAPIRRFFSVHRLEGRVGAIELALTEAIVYGGVGESFRPGYLNPLNDFQLGQYNETNTGNLALGVDVAWRSSFGIFSAQGLLDDAQVDDCKPRCQEPASYGFALVASGLPLPLSSRDRWFLSHTRVSNLSYRTPTFWERYSSRGVGLGRGFSDYDETRLGLDLLVAARVPIRLYGALRRQGEGDYRLPFPDSLAFGDTPGFLSGTVMRVHRVGVSGGGTIAGALSASGDVGVNRVTNTDHVPGRSRTKLEGRIRLVIEPRTVLRVTCRAMGDGC